jgi:SAM-dependent methyltransferase
MSERSAAEAYIDGCGEYTGSYEREKLKRDWEGKRESARKIVGDFKNRCGDPNGKRLIDIGFGNGDFVVAFAEAGAVVSGLEVNPVLFDIAQKSSQEAGITADLKLYDGSEFPFANGSFDYAFSTSVLEHVSDPRLFLMEISRVLAPKGRLYLAFPNRLAPRETHTGIWLLSYLPRALGQAAVRRIFKRNTIEELNLHFIGYLKLRRLLRGTGLTLRFEYAGKTPLRRNIKSVMGFFGIQQSAILKTIMIIAEKDR